MIKNEGKSVPYQGDLSPHPGKNASTFKMNWETDIVICLLVLCDLVRGVL